MTNNIKLLPLPEGYNILSVTENTVSMVECAHNGNLSILLGRKIGIACEEVSL